MKLSGGMIEWPKAATSRGAKRRAAERVPSPEMGCGVSPLEKFRNLRRNLVQSRAFFGKKLTVLQVSTFVDKNIAIMLDSGIDIVAYYFNFLVV